MKANMGKADKIIRLIAALGMLLLFVTGVASGLLGYVALGLAGVFTLTSIISFCPLYIPFGLSTCKVKEKENA